MLHPLAPQNLAVTPCRHFPEQRLRKSLRVVEICGRKFGIRVCEDAANIEAGAVGKTAPAFVGFRAERPVNTGHD
jgi:hypothetical protein